MFQHYVRALLNWEDWVPNHMQQLGQATYSQICHNSIDLGDYSWGQDSNSQLNACPVLVFIVKGSSESHCTIGSRMSMFSGARSANGHGVLLKRQYGETLTS